MKRRHPVGPLPVERHETGTAVAMALPVIMNQPTARALPAARSRRLAGMTKRVRFRGGIFGLGGKARQEAPGLGIAMCRRDILQKPPRLAHQPMAKRRGRHDPAALIGKLALFGISLMSLATQLPRLSPRRRRGARRYPHAAWRERLPPETW